MFKQKKSIDAKKHSRFCMFEVMLRNVNIFPLGNLDYHHI